MKKFAYISVMALCLGFTACDDFDLPNPAEPSIEQEPIFETNELTYTPDASAKNLITLNAADESAVIGQFTANDVPEGYSVQAVLQISRSDNFAQYASCAATVNEDLQILVAPDALEDAYLHFTKDPSAADIYGRLEAYLVSGDTKFRVGDPETYFGPVKFQITPYAPAKVIEDVYYFVYTTDEAAWNAKNAIALNHGSKSVYDDPKFSFAYDFPADLTAEGLFWKIVPASTLAANLQGEAYGCTEEDVYNENGTLTADAEAQAGVFFLDGPVLFNFNAESLEFDYFQAIPYFYTPGAGNGWSFPAPVMTTQDYVHYYGVFKLGKEFKFNPDAGWQGRDFGRSDEFVYEQQNGAYVGTGVADGSSNINVAAEGLYLVKLNYTSRETELYQINTVGAIGKFTGWGSEVKLTPSADNLTWTGEVELGDGDEFKIRFNDNWNCCLGGQLNELSPYSGNITVKKGGKYKLTVSFNALQPTATLE